MDSARKRRLKKIRDEEKKKPMYWVLNHTKTGVGGVVRKKPNRKKRDHRAKPGKLYAVVHFPKITGIGQAEIGHWTIETLAQTPETAKAKFMDKIWHTETWDTYHKAGHRIRRVRIIDLGDA